eukprot:2759369-Alexandrium_andersonii.AAC.1
MNRFERENKRSQGQLAKDRARGIMGPRTTFGKPKQIANVGGATSSASDPAAGLSSASAVALARQVKQPLHQPNPYHPIQELHGGDDDQGNGGNDAMGAAPSNPVSYTHLRAHETSAHL